MSRPTQTSDLRRSAQAKIAAGKLPSPDGLGGVGRSGSGKPCCVCGTKIEKCLTEKPTIEYEVQWQKAGRARLLRFHSSCFQAWVTLAREANRGSEN